MKTNLKSYSRPTVLALPIVALALFGFLLSTAEAAKPVPSHPAITSVVANFVNQTISITGQNFSDSPSVLLDNMQLVVTSSNATSIQATLPNNIGPGSYHLVEHNADASVASIDVTLGAGENDDRGNGNTAEGNGALTSLTTGADNTAIGFQTLYNDTTGQDNSAHGYQALFNNTTGSDNTANGWAALFGNTTGGFNTATGVDALESNSTGNANTATGFGALLNNTANDNTATGFEALFNNTTGVENTANGIYTLYSNTTAKGNTATGYYALYYNTSDDNTANGDVALFANTTGNNNTATGFGTLTNNTTGNNNTANGFEALLNNTGSSNIAVGFLAGKNLTTGSNNIDIGNQGVAGEANTIRIGDQANHTATFIAGIANATVTGSAVVIDTSTGQLGLVTSSARFKDAIEPMGGASEPLLSLRPVTFHYKKNIDPKSIPQFGLVAEEVEKVDPTLVTRDADGKPFTVRYEAVNAMLLNEFLKEHRKVEELEVKLAQQQKDFTARLKEQDAKIQKVSDRVELSKPAPRTVHNN